MRVSLLLRACRVGERDVPVRSREVDGGGTLHCRSLRDGEEVQAITARAATASFGQIQARRGGSAFELIAE
jgi:hypothetical protein